jgi:hypothetical protein
MIEQPYLDPTLKEVARKGYQIVQEQITEISELRALLSRTFQRFQERSIGKPITKEEANKEQITAGYVIPLDNSQNLLILDTDMFIIGPPKEELHQLDYELDFNPDTHQPLAFSNEYIHQIHHGEPEGLTIVKRTLNPQDHPDIQQAYLSAIARIRDKEQTHQEGEQRDSGLAITRNFITDTHSILGPLPRHATRQLSAE